MTHTESRYAADVLTGDAADAGLADGSPSGRPIGPTPSQILDNARAMVPHLRERIAETEQLRKLPDATVKEAEEAGIFSLLVPRSLGGAGGTLRDFVDLTRTLSRGHLSAGWVLSFLVEHNWMVGRFPVEAQNDVFGDRGYALMSGVIPPGRAVPVDGGYLVTGYWGYATGVMHAEWVQVFAGVEGHQAGLAVLLPVSEIEVEDTWYVSGMAGTGSHHIRATDLFVPEHRTVDVGLWSSRNNPGSALHPEALYSYAARDLLALISPAMAVGAAESMLEDYRKRIEVRRTPFEGRITADTATGQMRYGKAVAALRVGQAALEQALDDTVRANEETTDELTPELRATVKLGLMAGLRLTWESVEIAVRGSGTSVFKSDSPTQYFLRDLEMLLSHQGLDEDTMYTMAGAMLLDRAPEASSAFI